MSELLSEIRGKVKRNRELGVQPISYPDVERLLLHIEELEAGATPSPAPAPIVAPKLPSAISKGAGEIKVQEPVSAPEPFFPRVKPPTSEKPKAETKSKKPPPRRSRHT